MIDYQAAYIGDPHHDQSILLSVAAGDYEAVNRHLKDKGISSTPLPKDITTPEGLESGHVPLEIMPANF